MSRVLVGAAERTANWQFGEEIRVERGPAGPVQFWRGQTRYSVGGHFASWVETVPWWPGEHGEVKGSVIGRRVWRVEAARVGRSRQSFAGVFDLSWEPAADRWVLVRVHD